MASKSKGRSMPAPVERSRRFRILPMTVTMLALLLVVKLNEIYFDVDAIRDARAEAMKKDEAKAEEAKKEDAAKEEQAKPEDAASKEAAKDEAKPEEASKEAPKEEGKEGEHQEEAKKEEGGHGGGHGEAKPAEEPKTAGAGKMTVKEVEALKEKEAKPLYTQEELDLLQNLTKRRQELEAREAELQLKSKVLEATEKRISDKLGEMKTMETTLSKVVAEYNNQRNSEIKSLVKIYENMKPGDAAAIFNEMEMPILLEVIGQMSERKVAPVLAGMSPKKAKDVTQELAEMRKSQAARTAAVNTPQPAKN